MPRPIRRAVAARTAVFLALAAALVGLLLLPMTTPSQAATGTYRTRLEFSTSDPSLDSATGYHVQILGKVRELPTGVLDFYGTSVVEIPDRPVLNPGQETFYFAARVRLTRGAGNWNIMQKGYFGDHGQYKVSLVSDAQGLRISCRIKGTAGVVMAFSRPGVIALNGPFTYVGCKRVGANVLVLVNGSVVGRATGATGYIGVQQPVLVGSKGTWLASADQFLGQVDRAFVITY
jgi:hypothetical protein